MPPYPIIDLQVLGCTSSSSPNGVGFSIDTHGLNITLDNLFVELAGMTSASAAMSDQQFGIAVTVNSTRKNVTHVDPDRRHLWRLRASTSNATTSR